MLKVLKTNPVFKIFIHCLLVLSVLCIYSVANAYNIENMLGEYAQKADLSVKTKKESAGYLIVFTRVDLDRMKIKTLKELINYIPFVRYSENSSGLSDIAYAPYQTNTFNPLIVYINDRELITPFSGNGFQLIGQMDLSYIDHIEVYLGLPSYEIGFSTATMVIKMYTKKGYRENATVGGVYYGSYNTLDAYLYQGYDNDDYSYFFYLNHKRLNRKKINHTVNNKDYSLSRNKDIYDLYGEVENNNYRFEFQGVAGTLDNFLGQSWNMSVNTNNTDFYYLYSGIYFTSNDKTLKASLNYSYALTDNIQDSDSPLGFIPVHISIPVYPYSYTYLFKYNHMKLELEEQLSNLNLIKTIKMKNDSVMLGVRARYKRFLFKKQELGNVNIPQSSYNTEYVLSAYFENHYYINHKNMIITSLKTDRYLENGNVRDMTIYSGRLGYIFNNNSLTFKTFLFFGGTAPSPYVIYHQKLLSNNTINPQKALAVSGEIIYKHNSSVYSLLYSKTYFKNAIYFNGKEYKNTSFTDTLNSLSLNYTYNFDSFNKVMLNAWFYHLNSDNSYNYYGGYISLFNKIGKFDLYNNVSYREGYDDQKPAFNLNSTVIYHATSNLILYVKGNNLLNKAITADYYRINPLTKEKTILKRVPVFDRTIWIGMEYTF